MADSSRFPPVFPPPFASAWGDDRFGLWAEIEIPSPVQTEPVVQRLRWIEPGTFQMGSPENEPERLPNEGPQHLVTITQGIWLADTACTQRLWQAVMDHNPSFFKDDFDQPVELVGCYAIENFLNELESLVPECRADLPTEAEWEYACRAGTQTPFNFGPQITPEQVNYNGNYPYAGGETGLVRERTVPVKSLPPNPWGLYEMHGNVREWCADGLRDYTGETQRDPVGPVLEGENARRAVRGGSWINDARRARSAYRTAYHPGDADNYLGFRFCLRSIEPGQVPVQSQGSHGIRRSFPAPKAIKVTIGG